MYEITTDPVDSFVKSEKAPRASFCSLSSAVKLDDNQFSPAITVAKPETTATKTGTAAPVALNKGRNGPIMQNLGVNSSILFAESPRDVHVDKVFKTENGMEGKAIVLDDGTIVCRHGSFAGYLAAFTPEGEKLWQNDDMLEGLEADPVLDSKGNFYVAMNNGLGSVDSQGGTRWKVSSYGFNKILEQDKPVQYGKVINYQFGSSHGTPLVDEQRNTVYFGMYAYRFIALDSESGKIKWIYNYDEILDDCRPEMDGEGNVFFHSDDGVLHGLRPDGSTLFRKRLADDR